MLNEKEIVEDVLKDERFLNVCLSFCAVEASPQIKSTFVDLIREEQDLHTRVFQLAQQRQGRYPQVWGDYGFQAPQTWTTPVQAGQPAGAGYQAAPTAGTYQAGRPGAPFVQPWITPATQGMAAAPGGVAVAGRQYGPY